MYCIRSLFSHIRRSHVKVYNLNRNNNLKRNSYIHQIRFIADQVEDDSDKIIMEICKGNAEEEKRLRILMLEVEVMRQDGRRAPDSMKFNNWQHLMALPSKNQRSNYLIYLWKTEKARENEKAKKAARRLEFESTPLVDSKEHEDDLLYGIIHQSLFLRIRDQSVNNFDNYRALQALMHGQSVVIDCSYEEHMVWREAVNAAKQMTFVFGDNRLHKDPFNIHMCNVELEGEFMKQLRKNIPSLEEPWFPMNIHTESYLDIFPKENLVYLTPHCRNELTSYDPDAVYIVGCMVDKINNEPLSLAKAKKDGIKMARLPLDRYLEWAPGAKKNLNINHMIPILLDLRLTQDWEFSLRHIPRRKLMETKIQAMQNRIKHNPQLREEIPRNLRRHPSFKTMPYKQKKTRIRSLLEDIENM